MEEKNKKCVLCLDNPLNIVGDFCVECKRPSQFFIDEYEDLMGEEDRGLIQEDFF